MLFGEGPFFVGNMPKSVRGNPLYPVRSQDMNPKSGTTTVLFVKRTTVIRMR